MQTLNFNNVSIDIHEGPLAVMLSGGADSSLLFYILMKYATGPIHVINCGNGTTNNHEAVSAIKVVNKCIELTDNRNVVVHTHWIKHKTPQTLMQRNGELLQPFGINMLYNGFTRPPKEGIIVDYDTAGPIAVGGIDPGVDFPCYWKQEHSKIFCDLFKFDSGFQIKKPFYTPFININKQGIASLYKELNLLDTLYPVTRSCESLTLTEGHCGTCWWCKERMWAFERLE